MGVPCEQDERARRRDAAQLLDGLLGQRRRVDHHHVHPPEQRPQPVAELLLLLGRRARLAAVAEPLAGTALERVGVAGHAQPAHADDERPVAAVRAQAAALGKHDAARERHPADERVRVVVPRDEHERVPDAHDPAHQRELERRPARGEVPGEEQRPPPDRAVERGQREEVVVEVGGEHEAAQVARRAPVRRRGHEARQAHELLVQLLRDRARRSLRLLDGPERDRYVGPVGVVLRICDLAAGRQQERERQAAGERGAAGGQEEPAQPRGAVAPDRERHHEPGRERAQEHHHEEHPQVGGHGVASLVAHRLDVRELTLRDALGGLAVHGSDVNGQPRGEADRPKAGAPVHQRDVEVERALVERLHGELDAAHAEVALGAVGRERQQPPAESGDHHKGHRGGAADGPHRPQTSAGARGGYS